MPKTTFENKVAIITGSSNGIGKATAKLLVQRGVSVVINGRNEERLRIAQSEIEQLGGNVLALHGDISNIDFAREVVEQTLAQFGRLDIMINNAGISMRGDFIELDPSVYRTVFETNVQGAVNITIPALPHIKEQNGSVVFVSSLAGIHGLPGLSAYSASKMALRAIAESIRVEEASSNIHIGLVQAGFTQIEGNKQAIAANGESVTIPKRANAASIESVSKAILKNIERRKYVSTLSLIGKLKASINAISPRVVERILIWGEDYIKKE